MNMLTLNQLGEYELNATEADIANIAHEIQKQGKEAGSWDDINRMRDRIQRLIIAADGLASPKKEAVKASLSTLNDAIGQWRQTLSPADIGTRIFKNLVSFNADIMAIDMTPPKKKSRTLLYTVLGLGIGYLVWKKFLKKK